MPDITRVVGPWSDGSPLDAEDLLKDTFHYGRVNGFDGTKGGLELANGQLDFDGNFNGNQTVTSRYVRRGAITQGPFVSGWRQSRDVWYKTTFPDLDAISTPDMWQQARAVLACTWGINNNRNVLGADQAIDSVLIDITMDYTMASNQNYKDNDTEPDADFDSPLFRGFLGVWLDDVFYQPSATPIIAGRSSTVEPYYDSTIQYFNRADVPDFRTFSMKMRITSDETSGISGLSNYLSPGWHSVSVRVSGRHTIRIHGGAIIVTPIR